MKNIPLVALMATLASLAYPLAGAGQTLVERAARATAPTAGTHALLSLAEAEAQLERGNPEIIAARHALDAQRSTILSAGAAPNPTITTQVTSINPSRGLGAGNFYNKQTDTVLRIDQLIERGGKRELRIASAEISAQAAEQDLAEVRRQQKLALHLAYFDLKLAAERLRILEENVRLHAQAMAAAERRLAAGDIAAAELVRLRVEALRATNEARAAANERARARQALGLLLGVGYRDAGDWTAADAWPLDLPGNIGRSIDAESLSGRASLRAAQLRVSAAERARELARQLRTRDVSVGAQMERFPPDSGVSFGLSISVPLQTHYRYEGEIARAEADLGAAESARERELLRVLSEARGAQSEIEAAAERRRRLADELLPQARQALDAAEFAYSRGATSLMDVLDARRTLRSVEIEAATTAADFAKARSAWLAAMGTDNFRSDAAQRTPAGDKQ